jgi:hypothetical protein
MRRSHVEQRSRRYAPRQYVSDTHHDKRDAAPRTPAPTRSDLDAEEEAPE